MRGSQDHFPPKKVFTVRIRGCSHFEKLKCIREKMGPGKSVHTFRVFTSRGFTIQLSYLCHAFVVYNIFIFNSLLYNNVVNLS